MPTSATFSINGKTVGANLFSLEMDLSKAIFIFLKPNDPTYSLHYIYIYILSTNYS